MFRSASILCVLVIVFAGAGCTDVVEPVVDVDGKTIVVVPFADRSYGRFDSPVGRTLARAVTAHLEERREEQGDEVPRVVNQKSLAESLGRVDPTGLEIDGNVLKFETRRAGDVGILRGLAEVEVRILDAAGKRPEGALCTRSFTVEFPSSEGFSIDASGVLTGVEGTEEDIERGLIAEVAQKIAKLVYPHEPPARSRR
jgi:hypothetical protein